MMMANSDFTRTLPMKSLLYPSFHQERKGFKEYIRTRSAAPQPPALTAILCPASSLARRPEDLWLEGALIAVRCWAASVITGTIDLIVLTKEGACILLTKLSFRGVLVTEILC